MALSFCFLRFLLLGSWLCKKSHPCVVVERMLFSTWCFCCKSDLCGIQHHSSTASVLLSALDAERCSCLVLGSRLTFALLHSPFHTHRIGRVLWWEESWKADVTMSFWNRPDQRVVPIGDPHRSGLQQVSSLQVVIVLECVCPGK